MVVLPPAAAIGEGGGAALAGVACQRRTSSLSNGRRRRQNDQRNGAYSYEAMHWMYEWMLERPIIGSVAWEASKREHTGYADY
ncbi:MAG TPA: hypothetical protein VN729_05560 [Ktedonobacteraceae bacterium]|nr:hypothetical protein [Ktedonobacteraceae bacterium]